MKALEEKYEVRLAEKNKGFFVIVAKKRWLIYRNTLQL
jgi:hypothetical protein